MRRAPLHSITSSARTRSVGSVSRLFSGCDVGAQRMWPRQAPATRREVPLPVSIGDEAVDQTGATSRLQLILTATARAMRGVPRLHVPGGFQAGAVVMTNDGRSFTALGPVPAGSVAAG